MLRTLLQGGSKLTKLRPLKNKAFRRNSRYFSSDAVDESEDLVNVSINKKTGIATVSMQRAPVNSLNLELLQELSGTFRLLEDDRCKGMILTSALPTVFCAGLDITELYQADPERANDFWTAFQEMFINLYGISFPTAAVINGHSPAGGCLLALCCEFRVMVGPHYSIGLNETRLGIVPPKWVCETLMRAIPKRKAELALINGLMFSAEEAVQIGLVDQLAVDKEDAIACAEHFMTEIRKTPGIARSLTKLSLRDDMIEWLHQNRDKDRIDFLEFVRKPEQQSIIGQYLEDLKNKKN